MNTATEKSVKNDGGGGGESFALSRLLFGDLALVKGKTGQQLDVERPHGEGPNRGFASESENFGQDIVEVCPVDEVVFELLDLDGKVFVLEFLRPGLVIVNLLDQNE